MFECAFINTTEETKIKIGVLTWELLNQICIYIYIYEYIYLVLLFIGCTVCMVWLCVEIFLIYVLA